MTPQTQTHTQTALNLTCLIIMFCVTFSFLPSCTLEMEGWSASSSSLYTCSASPYPTLNLLVPKSEPDWVLVTMETTDRSHDKASTIVLFRGKGPRRRSITKKRRYRSGRRTKHLSPHVCVQVDVYVFHTCGTRLRDSTFQH